MNKDVHKIQTDKCLLNDVVTVVQWLALLAHKKKVWVQILDNPDLAVWSLPDSLHVT